MATLLISRKQYNSLIDNHAAWMARNWTKTFKRDWSLGGVRITGTTTAVANVASMIG